MNSLFKQRTYLAFPGGKDLKRKQFLGLWIYRHDFAVEDKRRDVGGGPGEGGCNGGNIRVLFEHILRVSTKDSNALSGGDQCILDQMHLCTFPVILELARKCHALEAIQNLTDGLCGMRKHRLQRNSRAHGAVLGKVGEAVLKERRNDELVIGESVEDALEQVHGVLALRIFWQGMQDQGGPSQGCQDRLLGQADAQFPRQESK